MFNWPKVKYYQISKPNFDQTWPETNHGSIFRNLKPPINCEHLNHVLDITILEFKFLTIEHFDTKSMSEI